MKASKWIYLMLCVPFLLASGTISNLIGEKEYAFSINVKSINGKKLENVIVNLYSGNELVVSATTNSDGVANFDVERREYNVKLSNLPDGYYLSKEYKTNSTDEEYNITCLSQVIEKAKPNSDYYQVGDIIYDYIFQNTNGEYLQISKLFETYEMVFLNFFYIDCYWCNIEFPFMEEAYQEYSDKVAILALSYQDTEAELKSFSQNEGYSFDICRDTSLFTANFEVVGFPTSVVIDRYGVITMIHDGAIQSKTDFVDIFEEYTGEDYLPSDVNGSDDSENAENVKPTYIMPESSEIEQAINGTNFPYSWYAETDEEDAEYSWPWLVSEDGESIYPSNSKQSDSYGTIYTKVKLKPDEVFVFDYFSSTEEEVDCLYITIDDVIVNVISGVSEDWKKCFAFVPSVEGEYEVGFTYLKDADTNYGEDKVFIKNVRILPTTEIDEPIYMKKHASNVFNATSLRYEQFTSLVFNNEDGYYHVNSSNGPILLADLHGENATHYNPYSINTLAINGYFKFGDKDYTERILQYSTWAGNTYLGMSPVTEELYQILYEFTTYYHFKEYGDEANYTPYENQWLDICCYYDAYCTNGVEMPDPIKGLATISAYKATLGNQNFVDIDLFVMPRGKLSLFVPETSGVYKINSIGSQNTIGWIFLGDDRENDMFFESDKGARTYRIDEDNQNYCMYVYLEANTKYYICSAFDNMYDLGTIQFNIEYVGDSVELFTLGSVGAFTTENDDMTGNIISRGIDVEIGEDGYYHEKLEDGTLGSIVYCDFTYPTYFNGSIINLIDNGYFDLSYDKVEEVELEGGKNYTSIMNGYKELIIQNEGDTKGCVPVDKNLAIVLQALMDVYTFSGVENSWLKLCYYYKHIGA